MFRNDLEMRKKTEDFFVRLQMLNTEKMGLSRGKDDIR